MDSQPTPSAEPKPEPKFKPHAGTNVFAKVNGKESGPFYLVQIEGGKATLQAGKSLTVNLSDITKAV